MINKEFVYKIKLYGLNQDKNKYFSKEAWVHGYNVIPKIGGSGKTFTSKKLVNKMFNSIKNNRQYKHEFVCEIVTFRLEQISFSSTDV